jgi:dTDP-glucose pyrophosphorylase
MVRQMKALVLSGGAGTRSRPHPHTPAERPVPVAEEVVLSRATASIADAGITRAEVIERPRSDLAPQYLIGVRADATDLASIEGAPRAHRLVRGVHDKARIAC